MLKFDEIETVRGLRELCEVAETTGKPNFVVPALFAAVAAELVMGDQSITAFQRRPGSD